MRIVLSRTHIIVALGSSSSLTLSLGAAGVVPAILLVLLLLLLRTTSKHGEDRGRGDGLVVRGLGLLDLGLGVFGGSHLDGLAAMKRICMTVREMMLRYVSQTRKDKRVNRDNQSAM